MGLRFRGSFSDPRIGYIMVPMGYRFLHLIGAQPGAAALAVMVCVLAGPCAAKDRTDQRLKGVTSVFVSGNNQAAEAARQVLLNGKTCLMLAGKAADADGVLDISTDSQRQSGGFGDFGARTWIASGTLTLKSGDLVWSHSERFSDAPMKSGGKTAGNLLVRHLADSAGCKERR
jgi:hypothetical protein